MHWHVGSTQVSTVGLLFLLATRLGNPCPCRVCLSHVNPGYHPSISKSALIRRQKWCQRLYSSSAVNIHLQDSDLMCQSHSMSIFLLLIGINKCEHAEMGHGRSMISECYFPNTWHLETGCWIPGCDWWEPRAPVVWVCKKWAEVGCKCRTVQRHTGKQGTLLVLNRKMTKHFHPSCPPLRIKTSPFRSHVFLWPNLEHG